MDPNFTPYSFTFDDQMEPYDSRTILPKIDHEYVPQKQNYNPKQTYEMMQACRLCLACLEFGVEYHYNQVKFNSFVSKKPEQQRKRMIMVSSMTYKCNNFGCNKMMCQKNAPGSAHGNCPSDHNYIKFSIMSTQKKSYKTLSENTFCSWSCLLKTYCGVNSQDELQEDLLTNIRCGNNSYVNSLLINYYESEQIQIPELVHLIITNRFHYSLENTIKVESKNVYIPSYYLTTRHIDEE